MNYIILLLVCVLIGIQTLWGKEPEVQPLIDECVAKGMEKQKAETLINAIRLEKQIPSAKAPSLSNRVERAKVRSHAVNAIDTLSSNKLSRAVALGLWGNSVVRKEAMDRLFELKDSKVTDIVIQALEDNTHLRSGAGDEVSAHEAFVIDLVKLLNVLAGSNYQLDIYNDSDARRKEIIKAAKEKLARQKEMESKGLVAPNSTNIVTNGFVSRQSTNETDR